MPDGVVQWFDPKRGEGRVVRGGREYPVEAAEIEPHARVAGARVHFDITRRNGVAVATGVRLRGGTHVSWRQRRFGDLTGARRPDTKGSAPFAQPHPEAGLRLAARPMEVARGWAASLDGGDVDAALLLYAPGVRLHLPDGGEVEGVAAAARVLPDSPPLAGELRLAGVHGEDDTVVVEWAPAAGPGPTWRTRLRVEHGEITEQWLGVEPPAPPPVEEAAPPVEVVTSGEFGEAEVAYAREKLTRLLRLVEEPVLFARITLRRFGDPARERPVNVKAAVDVNGTPVRVHIAAHEVREAVDLVERRLRDKLEHRAERIEARRQGVLVAEPGEWRHGMLPIRRPEYFERPPEEREVIRRKTFAVDELTPDEAAFDMEMLDYDFYLFRDLASGGDALLERLPDGTYRITRLRPAEGPTPPSAIALSEAPAPAPTLTLEEAIARLDAAGERFVFFADAATGRGMVVYRRYDGHYGVLEPADAGS
jgi:hypothetical protein